MGLFLTGVRPTPVSADEESVRSTLEPVDPGAPPAEAPDAPAFNQPFFPNNPHNGLSGGQVASDWVEGRHQNPFWARLANPTASFAQINGQVDSSGRAAGRELAGDGQGGMAYAEGIEPVIRDGGAFGADYFAVERTGIQPTMGNEMSLAPGLERDEISAANAAALAGSRRAASASLYQAWFSQQVGG